MLQKWPFFFPGFSCPAWILWCSSFAATFSHPQKPSTNNRSCGFRVSSIGILIQPPIAFSSRLKGDRWYHCSGRLCGGGSPMKYHGILKTIFSSFCVAIFHLFAMLSYKEKSCLFSTNQPHLSLITLMELTLPCSGSTYDLHI